MSDLPGSQRRTRGDRRRWLMLAVPLLLGLLLFSALFWTLHAASDEDQLPSLDGTLNVEAAPPEVPAAQSASGDVRFEVGFRSDARTRHSQAVAWGDVDGDGDLDLAVGNGRAGTAGFYNQINQLYIYDAESGQFRERDIGGVVRDTRDLAWGDMDGDGDLDLLVANYGQKNQLYINEGGELLFNLEGENPRGWESTDAAQTTSIALGDYDGDGDYDLAVGNQGSAPANQIWRNVSGTLRLRWQEPLSQAQNTRDLAWGDIDGDGDLDLAVGNYDGADQIYMNDDTQMVLDPQREFGRSATAGAAEEAGGTSCGEGAGRGYFLDRDYAMRTRAIAWGDWDGDGDLDLATGGGSDQDNLCGAFIFIYEYDETQNRFRLDGNHGWAWSKKDSLDKPSALEWGDWDGDGDLDLVVGVNAGSGNGRKNRVYENRDGQMVLTWRSPLDEGRDSETTFGIALGDADIDGDLDLAVANGGMLSGGQRNFILRNSTPVIALGAEPWTSPQARKSTSLAWGDWDRDGDLDLAVGNYGEANQVYENVNGTLFFNPEEELGWESTVFTDDLTTSVAWADWNGDGFLDLAVGNVGQEDLIYQHTGTTLSLSVPSGVGWQSPEALDTQSLAWGDWDRDNDLDLVAGHCGGTIEDPVPQNAIVYRNDTVLSAGSSPTMTVGWTSPEPICVRSVAWGNWDNDSDLDLALGARVFENIGSRLILDERTRTGWDGKLDATSVAWGDMNGDGRLDLAVGTRDANYVFRNLGGQLVSSGGWESPDLKETTAVAWGDVDGDEDLDLAVANSADSGWQANQVFENVDGMLRTVNTTNAAWETRNPGQSSSALMRSHDVAWGDVDGDGDLDLAVANFCDGTGCEPEGRKNQIYYNELQGLSTDAAGLPRLRIEEPYQSGSANFFASPEVLSTQVITIPYVLRDPANAPIGRIRVWYSLDGGDNWRPAQPTTATVTANLASSALGVRHEFGWDTFGSEFFGKSDNVAIRIEAFDTPEQVSALDGGTYKYPNGVAGSFQRPKVTATSFPFRVQSTQIRVVDEDNGNQPVEGAVVFRLPAGQAAGAQLMPSADQPLQTDSQGFLPGGGFLESGDRLIALKQVEVFSDVISFTNKVSLFHTSGVPNETGLSMYNFRNPGQIELAVSEENPLLLFQIDIALEWDARNDESFRTELADGIMRASELLYDVTNGQAALGGVNVWQSKELWPFADVVVQANNSMRPSAAIGGFTQIPISETVVLHNQDGLTETKVISNAYLSNQIRMGTVWDPFGEYTADLGPHWWQALAHELAHYLFFLPDNYLGFKDDVALGKINCQGSFMTSTFDPEYSEFLTEEGWKGACERSLAQRTTERTDWDTVSKFYPMLRPPAEPISETANPGPTNLPLEVTIVNFVEPTETRSTLRARNFEVRNEANERWRLPSAQAFLIQRQMAPGTGPVNDPTDDVLIQLGTPTGGGDRLKVRGAYPGDRLCLFDRSGDQAYAGCVDPLSSSSVAIPVREADNEWQPRIDVTAETSRTMHVTVTQSVSPGTQLNVQLFPMHYWSKPGAVGLSPTGAMNSNGDLHTQTLKLLLPAYEIAARVWVEGDPGRETIEILKLNPPWPAVGGPSSVGIGGPSSVGIGGPSSVGIGGPSSVGIGGPSSVGIGGPSSVGIGGPSSVGIGGPSSVGIGGPSSVGIGGPSSVGIGGPSSNGIGGAPILSADAQVVVYSKKGFFEDNGVESLKILSAVPELACHPWLLPVGQAYHVTVDPTVVDADATDQVIGLTYLQRDVPEGFEHTLAVYFLPDGGTEWQRLTDEPPYVENLIVADLQGSDGTYAVMSSVQMPTLTEGRNLFSYPLSVSQTVTSALQSLGGAYSNVVVAPGEPDAFESPEMLEFGKSYWIDVTADVTPYLAPPVRLPDGRMGFLRQSIAESCQR